MTKIVVIPAGLKLVGVKYADHQHGPRFHLIYAIQRTFIVSKRITVLLVSSLTALDTIASLHTNNTLFSCLVESKQVKLKTSRTVILPSTVSVLFLKWANPVLFFIYFQTHITNFTINKCEKYPSSIRESNPRPFTREFTPITARPMSVLWHNSPSHSFYRHLYRQKRDSHSIKLNDWRFKMIQNRWK